MELANDHGFSSYFYGDTEATLSAMCTRLATLYPRHRLAGAHSPPFRELSEEEDRVIVERINSARPDIVWVGLGMPKQDIWASKHKSRLNAKAVIGVGAAFGFMAGTVRRCPSWIGDHGLEWAYRLAVEPRKLWRRNLIEGPMFLWHVLLEEMKLRRFS
jgi:N-acetylglucosaminyldiphosphoundecaprenol N-acetyl-beta-D-mannosaminyltransferase